MRTINLKSFFYLLSIFLFAFSALSTKPAQAITGNFEPDPDHDYVGLVVFYDSAGVPLVRCSGTLLSPRIFLTAGHCAVNPNIASARVWAYQVVAPGNITTDNPVTGYSNSCDGTANPNLCATATSATIFKYGFTDFEVQTLPETKDVAVIVLDGAGITPPSGEFANLASAGFLDTARAQLGRNTEIFLTISGYGNLAINPEVIQSPERQRFQAVGILISLNSHWTDGFNIKVSQNPSKGKGGACTGDSGGPIFYGDFRDGSVPDTIVAISSFGANPACAGLDYNYRTDQKAVLDFILGIAADFGQDITICDPSDVCVTCNAGVCP